MSVGDHSFTHHERLLNASQFQRVFDQAKKSNCDVFTILSRENSIGHPRLGIVVAKRNLKRAVDRNLVRRIIRESFRLSKAQLPASDFIVILKKPLERVQREQLRQQLLNHWNKNAVL